MSSELKLTNIRHPSSGSNNLVLASDGKASFSTGISNAGTIDAGTIGSGVSGTFNHINTTDLTGTSKEIDNLFSDTYDGYMIYFLKVQMASETADFKMQLLDNSGTVVTLTKYSYSSQRYAPAGNSISGGVNANAINLADNEIGNGDGEHFGGSIFLEGVRSTTTATAFSGALNYSTVANYIGTANIAGYYNDVTGTFRGIKLFSNQTFSTGKIITYGVRQ